MHPILADLQHEEVWLLILNKANRVMRKIQLSKGGISDSVVDIRMIMKEAIDNLAVNIVLCHNHPSGSTVPSANDDDTTFRLRKAGQIMGIALLDHIIIADQSYYSYLDEGRF